MECHFYLQFERANEFHLAYIKCKTCLLGIMMVKIANYIITPITALNSREQRKKNQLNQFNVIKTTESDYVIIKKGSS